MSQRTRVNSAFGSLARAHRATIAVGLIALVVLGSGLGVNPYHRDEFITATLVRGSWADLWRATMVEYRDYHPLHHALCKLFTDGVGVSRWSLRVPGVVAGATFVAWLFALVKRRTTGPAAGLVALLLLANPAFRAIVGEARSYPLLLLTSVFAVHFTVQSLHAERPRDAWIAGVAWGLAYWSHPVALFEIGAVLSVVVTAALCGDRTRRSAVAAMTWRAALAFVLVASVGLWSLVRILLVPRGIHDSPLIQFDRPVVLPWSRGWTHGMEFARFVGQGVSVIAFAIVVAMAAVGAVRLWSRHRLELAICLALLAVPWVVLGALPFGHGFGIRYLAFQLPALLYLAAAASLDAGRATSAIAVIVLGAAGSIAPQLLPLHPRGIARTNWPALCAHVRAAAPDGALVLISEAGPRRFDPTYLETWQLPLAFGEDERFRFVPLSEALADLDQERDTLVLLAHRSGFTFDALNTAVEHRVTSSHFGMFSVVVPDPDLSAPRRLAALGLALADLADTKNARLGLELALRVAPESVTDDELCSLIEAKLERTEPARRTATLKALQPILSRLREVRTISEGCSRLRRTSDAAHFDVDSAAFRSE